MIAFTLFQRIEPHRKYAVFIQRHPFIIQNRRRGIATSLKSSRNVAAEVHK